jgi:hypothetical protein
MLSGVSPPRAASARPDGWKRRAPVILRNACDVLIAAYAVGLGIIAVGGADLGVLSVNQPAKPVLALIVLVPLRFAMGGRSWLADLAVLSTRQAQLRWQALHARVPAAALDTLFAVLTVRLATLTAGFFANLTFEPEARGFTVPFASAKFVEVFVALDSGWYWDIATRGYYFRPDGQSSVAFFPLYPLLMRAVAAPFGGGAAATWIAGIVVAASAYLLALMALHRFTERVFESREVARRTVLYVAVFPWSLFMGRVYSESVFLLTSVLAVSHAFDGRWRHAGVWGALATLTRPNGILIALPLALLALRDRPSVRQLTIRALWLAPIPLVLCGFCAYIYTLTGDPFGWLAAQSKWDYSLGHLPWLQLQRVVGDFLAQGPYRYFLASDLAVVELLQAVTGLVFVVLAPFIFRYLGAALGAYVLVSLLVPLSSNTLEGIGRYASVLFPAFMLVASRTTPRTHEALVMVSLVFRTLLVFFFVTWQPIH